MAETMITPTVLAPVATMVLKNEAVLHQLLRNPSDEARFTGDEKVGDTIKILTPAPADVREFSGTATARSAAETTTDLVIEKHFFDQIEVSAQQRTLELKDFSRLYVEPVMKGMAEALSSYAAEKFVGIPFFTGTEGDPPDAVNDVTNITKVLSINKAPRTGRIAIVDPTGEADLMAIEAFHAADKRGDGGAALRASSLGSILGFDWFMDQSIPTHTAGTMAAESPLVDVGGGVAEGATVMDIDDAGAGSQTILIGDLFSVAGVPGYQGVFTNNTTASSGQITAATFTPAAPAGGFPDSNAITITSDHTKNIAYSPGAFTFVTFPPTASEGAKSSSFFDASLGLGVRVTFDFSSASLADTITFETFAGCAVRQKELAVIVLG